MQAEPWQTFCYGGIIFLKSAASGNSQSISQSGTKDSLSSPSQAGSQPSRVSAPQRTGLARQCSADPRTYHPRATCIMSASVVIGRTHFHKHKMHVTTSNPPRLHGESSWLNSMAVHLRGRVCSTCDLRGSRSALVKTT